MTWTLLWNAPLFGCTDSGSCPPCRDLDLLPPFSSPPLVAYPLDHTTYALVLTTRPVFLWDYLFSNLVQNSPNTLNFLGSLKSHSVGTVDSWSRISILQENMDYKVIIHSGSANSRLIWDVVRAGEILLWNLL